MTVTLEIIRSVIRRLLQGEDYRIVPEDCYIQTPRGRRKAGSGVVREVDFDLKNGNEKFRCEVKLMGKGNPESADAVIARDSKVFVADKLSDLNKEQLDERGVEWVELRSDSA